MHTDLYASTPYGAGNTTVPLAPLAATTTSQILVPDEQPDAFYFRALEQQGIFLNEAQIQAVRHGDGPLLTLAGAGSGKTSVLVCRTGYLITVRQVSPRSILLVTFSSKAAAEMKQRIAGLPGMTPRMAQDVQARTYHAFFLLLLRRQGYDQDILSETRYQHIILKRMLREMGLQDEYQPETLLSELSRCKMNLIDISALPEKTIDERNIKTIFSQYEQWKQANHKMDFDDVLLFAYQLLRRSPELLRSLQERFVYVMNDEFQDTNQLQYELVRMIAAPQHNFMVVGDDDQTIYTFNGASHEYILDFHKLYPDARTVTLDINYRSTSSIVGLGNEVIRRNKKRKPKQLQATKASDIAPRYYRPGDSNEEAQTVIARILDEVTQQRKRPYSDFAILYRSASDSRAMLEQLVLREVPFVHYGGGDVFYEQWMVKPVIDHLRLSLYRRNFEAMEGILPTLYINREKGMEFIRKQEAVQRKKGPLAYLLFLPELKDFQKDKLKDRLAQIKTFLQMKPVDAIKEMRRSFYDTFLETGDRSVLTPHKEVLKETLDELESAAKPFATVEAFVAHVDQMIAKHKEMELLRQDADADRVTVMTIHKSKGLEFPVVFVIGVSDGMLPHSSALEQPKARGDKGASVSTEEQAAALEEERRLAYVAITRAREELIVSSPAYFRGKKAEVSQFILAPFRKVTPPGGPAASAARAAASDSAKQPKGQRQSAAADKSPFRTVNETVYAWVCTSGGCNAWSRISTQQETKVKDKACPLCSAPMRRGSKTIAVRQG